MLEKHSFLSEQNSRKSVMAGSWRAVVAEEEHSVLEQKLLLLLSYKVQVEHETFTKSLPYLIYDLSHGLINTS